MMRLALSSGIILACAGVAALGWATPLHAMVAAVILLIVVPSLVNLLLGVVTIILFVGLSLMAALYLGPIYDFERTKEKDGDKSLPLAS